MHIECTSGTLEEQAGYFLIADEHLYTTLHKVEKPMARVLLVGPFAASRHHAYLPWVRWARYLQASRMEALRFDYRGVGESTGSFEQMSFSDWMEDVGRLAAWYKEQSPSVPMLLHGLGLGALFAAKIFEQGIGEGLIAWAPPPDAQDLLRSLLLNWVMLQKLGKRSEEQRPFADYMRQLETEGFLEVNGYVWSAALWRDSLDFKLPAAMADPASAAKAYRRPVHIAALGREATPLVREGLAGYEEAKDFEWLFAANAQWISSHFAAHEGCKV